MEDMALPYFVGTVSELQSCGIQTDGLKKSLIGEIVTSGEGESAITTDTHLAIIHLQNVGIEQFNAIIRANTNIIALSQKQIQNLISTADWSTVGS